MLHNYKNIEEVFKSLNAANVNYLVLRNWENLLDPQIYVGGHGDIDILCEDSRDIVSVLNAESYAAKDIPPYKGDGTHYFIYVNKERVYLDLRHIGDDYYCEKWERDLLKNKIKNLCFYVMRPKDYFFTLIYHSILQKKSFSQEYHNRLINMAKGLGIDSRNGSQTDFLNILMMYMRDNGYKFRYCKDSIVPQRYHLVDRDMIEYDFKAYWNYKYSSFKLSYWQLLKKIKNK